jgi:hypothetical protein
LDEPSELKTEKPFRGEIFSKACSDPPMSQPLFSHNKASGFRYLLVATILAYLVALSNS